MLGYHANELIDANISKITHLDLQTEWEQRQRLARADIGRYELMQGDLETQRSPQCTRSATR